MIAPAQRGRMISGINVTPLVDICLVLLIVFMITASTIRALGMRVALPEAATGSHVPTALLTVVIRADGSAAVDGVSVGRDAGRRVRDAVARHRSQHAEVQAVITADRAAAHGRVVEFLDLLQQQDVTRFAVSVDRP